MKPELMGRFLAELEAGEIPRTETTAQIAVEFTRALRERRGRGRPKKEETAFAWLRQRLNDKGKGPGDKRTVQDLLQYLSGRVLAGDTFARAQQAAAIEFNRSRDGIRKAIGPYGKQWVDVQVKGEKQWRSSPLAKALARLGADVAAGRFAEDIAAGRLDPDYPHHAFPDDLPLREFAAEIDRRWPPAHPGK